VKDFLIEGGDALGTGVGDPGYVIPDEVWEDAHHDRAGILCMANASPNLGGAQFLITAGPAYQLDAGHTMFGECSPVALVKQLAAIPAKDDHPLEKLTIKKVTITKGQPGVGAGSASVKAPATPPPATSKR
jgi:peptidyl-prolyl cis-trans isomerase A (cyclophilin A)